MIFKIEGHYAGVRADVPTAQADLLDLLRTYAGGQFTSAMLDATHPALAWLFSRTIKRRPGHERNNYP